MVAAFLWGVLAQAAGAHAHGALLGIPEADVSLSIAQLDSGVAHAGSVARVRRVLARAQRGEPLTIAILGGSISAGSTLGVHNRKGSWLWHGRLFSWFNQTWPNSGHRRFNGAVPASTPAYVDGCLHFHLPRTADLILIEYTLNTLDWREYERLLRRTLAYPRKPAVILVSMFKQWHFPHTRGATPLDERAAATAARVAAGKGGRARGIETEDPLPESFFADLGGAAATGKPLSSYEYTGETRAMLLAQYYVCTARPLEASTVTTRGAAETHAFAPLVWAGRACYLDAQRALPRREHRGAPAASRQVHTSDSMLLPLDSPCAHRPPSCCCRWHLVDAAGVPVPNGSLQVDLLDLPPRG